MIRQTPARRLVAAVVLVAVAAAVGVVRLRYTDRRVRRSTPPVAVEGFVRALAAHRFNDAVLYLSDRQRSQIVPLTLEVRTTNLERQTGRIWDVHGKASWQVGDRAYAVAVAKTESAGGLELGFGLVRDDHGWRIDELYDLYR